MEHELVWSAVVAWMTSKGLEMAKGISWLPIDGTTERLNWLASRVAAAVAAVGVHATFDPQAGVLTITGLTVAGMAMAALEFAKQLCLQELFYAKLVKRQEES